jgi:hypothetical protein
VAVCANCNCTIHFLLFSTKWTANGANGSLIFFVLSFRSYSRTKKANAQLTLTNDFKPTKTQTNLKDKWQLSFAKPWEIAVEDVAKYLVPPVDFAVMQLLVFVPIPFVYT